MALTLAEAIQRADVDHLDRLPPSSEEVSDLLDVVTLFRLGLHACIDQYQGGVGQAKARRLVAFADRCGVDFAPEKELRHREIYWVLRSSKSQDLDA